MAAQKRADPTIKQDERGQDGGEVRNIEGEVGNKHHLDDQQGSTHRPLRSTL
jgi:hypothetical protein